MAHKTDKIQKTNTVSSMDLDRYEGTVKLIRDAWNNLPEDVNITEREMFIEITSRVLLLQNTMREKEKNNRNLN